MTEHQKTQFLNYGCLSRAIMTACNGPSIDDFCAKYDDLFITDYYGMLQADKIEHVIKDLGYVIIADEWDFDSVRAKFEDGNKVVLLSHVSLNKDESAIVNHASVLVSISVEAFQIWTSSQNGNAGVLPPFVRALWNEKRFHGLALRMIDH